MRVTTSTESESSPKWSPNGKYLSFLSSRPGKAKGAQVWLMDRRGGEAYQFTELKGHLSYYEWSPDSSKLALVLKDFNLPLLGSEQMYQALRNVGTKAQLIIYPGENHGIGRPSFQRDRMQRYLDWYAKFLKTAPQVTPSGGI